MTEALLNASTKQQLAAFQASNHHALLLVGPNGGGKEYIALVAGALLMDDGKPVDHHPYIRVVRDQEGKALGIEAIREVTSFLRLKVPGQEQGRNRVVIIPNAHTMTTEAQNALLKTLEEPPAGSVLILTATSERSLLPTIASRVQTVAVKRLPKADLEQHFATQGHDTSTFNRVYQVSGGLIGLMHALLSDEDHPLLPAIETARQLLQKTTFERLAMVDSLSKQPELSRNTLFVLQQMAHVSLQASQPNSQKRWQDVLKASYDASQALHNSGQAKLVLTGFMLQF